uniref:DJ-1/PfpI domain-containing protein n=1 Tax=Glossina brevipalpis TaxID=37001 RepID=A0A1A9W8B5_9MUSC
MFNINRVFIRFAQKISLRQPLLYREKNNLLIHKFVACNIKMPKTALIVLASGAEEMEFVISADVLRRAGIKVTIAGLADTQPVKCSRDVVIIPDTSLEKVKEEEFNVIILPGGICGCDEMSKSDILGELLKKQEKEERLIAAICAAPGVLAAHSIALGKTLTSYPGLKSKLDTLYKYVDDQKVIQDGKLITSRGPGTAFEFALKISEVLAGEEKRNEVAKALLLQ